MQTLTFDWLRGAVAGKGAAFRVLTRLAPVGGPGDKLFPPTYKHANADDSLYSCVLSAGPRLLQDGRPALSPRCRP